MDKKSSINLKFPLSVVIDFGILSCLLNMLIIELNLPQQQEHVDLLDETTICPFLQLHAQRNIQTSPLFDKTNMQL
jgi:hypothetical protein